LPTLPTPGGTPPLVYLRQLGQIALNQQTASRQSRAEYQIALDHELRIIEEQGPTHYFLIVHDLVCFARSRNILCQGRGNPNKARKVPAVTRSIIRPTFRFTARAASRMPRVGALSNRGVFMRYLLSARG
jgi:error-prone DNA polymerase